MAILMILKEGDTANRAFTLRKRQSYYFYRVDPTVAGGRVLASQATSTYTMIINDVDLERLRGNQVP
jgi:hypothetical protein